MTLRENVGLGDLKRLNDDCLIIEAMEKSQFTDSFDMCNGDIDQNIGKLDANGIDLSGGQWQRLALARAYFSRAAIIVLDEPTSSLDPVAESKMYSLFLGVMKNRGTIMISHRLASSKIADKILVVNDGIISECGSHEELMIKNDIYANMYNIQSSWYLKKLEEDDESATV